MSGAEAPGELRPELAAYLARPVEQQDGLSLDERRAAYERKVIEDAGDGPEMAVVKDAVVQGFDVPVRVYMPAVPAPRWGVLYLHGGGWALGSIAGWDAPCRALAQAAGAVVVSVDYRLAPEHPFPAALEDAWNAVVWMENAAPSLGIDRGRLAIAGDSAGANLAAACARRAAANHRSPALRLQALVYPALDAAMDSDSYRELGTGYGLEASEMADFWAGYLQGADPADPEASPLRAEDLKGVAPALVLTASHDPLRDEGEAYARRLRDAGIAVECERLEGTVHGFMRMLAVTPAAGEAVARIAAALAAAEGAVGARGRAAEV